MAFVSTGKAPGVYIDEVQVPGPIPPAPTAIAAFVGPAQMGPLRQPTLLLSAQQFAQTFGGYIEDPFRVYVTHAVNGFFAEGGGECYFVRIGTGVQASLNLNDQSNAANTTLVVTAIKEGEGGNHITVQVDNASIAQTTAPRQQAQLTAAANQGQNQATIAKADAQKFNPGDTMLIEDGGTSETATVVSITTNANATITFAANLTNNYSAAGDIRTPDLTAGTLRIPVASVTGMQVGTYVSITQNPTKVQLTAPANAGQKQATIAKADAKMFNPGDTVVIEDGGTSEKATVFSITTNGNATITFAANLTNSYTAAGDIQTPQKTEQGVVRTVDTIGKAITLTNGLVNTYPQDAVHQPVAIATLEFTLTINWPNKTGQEKFANLSMDPRHSQYFGKIVNSAAVTVALADPPSPAPPAQNLPKPISTTLSGGVADNITTITTADYHTGIDTLLKIDEANLLCVPDIVAKGVALADTQDVQSYMIAHCEKVINRFAILDPAWEDLSKAFDPSLIIAQRNNMSSERGMGSLYYPWIAISNPLGSGRIMVPPSGHIAGVYANNDNQFLVFKAPANEPITSALDLSRRLTDADQGPLNDLGINVIRSFPAQGILIWGARTIAPPDVTQWRYNSVRRFTNFVEASLRDGTRFAVFEPNNLTLWGQLKRLISGFLTTQWQAGALEGATAADAFKVVVDATLNTPQTIALGQVIVQITMFTTPPAEYVVLQIIQEPGGATVSE